MAVRQSAAMSNAWGAAYAADKIIDGNYGTFSFARSAVDNWVSVQVSAGTRIGYVAMYSTRNHWAYTLGDVEVWLGASMGDTSSASAVMCGETSYDPSHGTQPCMRSVLFELRS